MEERTYSLGYWIHWRRKALDLTQAGLASLVSCSPETIKKIERDERRPSLQIAELLANALVLKPHERAAFLQSVQKKVPVDHLTLDARPLEALHSSLPAETTPFFGRERELDELAAWLANPDCQLLALVGPGGAGKTRLALKAAEGKLADYRHGACFVPLVGLEDPRDLAAAALDCLRLPRSDSAGPQEQLLGYLKNKSLLLVLDNFEHLLPETGLLTAILQAAPEVALLVTSRQRLNLQSEWVLMMDGLAVPPVEDGTEIEKYSSAALFVQTARRQRAGFKVDETNYRAVARICQLVEGMPLAVELAAAWIPVLEPEAIAAGIERGLDILEAGLGDLPERQRSMRAVFDASWKLLSENEQRAMEQLAVFRGGFTPAAAEAAFDIPPKQLLALVNKCWVQAGDGGRLNIHELVRQYARERSSAEAGAWERFKEQHSAYFCGLLKAQGDWFCQREVEAITEIKADLHNIEAAWSWALEHSRTDLVAGAVYSLGNYYDWSSLTLAGKQSMDAAVNCLSAEFIPAGIDPDSISLARARALTLLGSFSEGYQEKDHPYQEAGSLLDRLEQIGVDTRSERAYLLFHDAILQYRQGPEVFRSLMGQSAALYRELGDKPRECYVLFVSASCFWEYGNLDQVQDYARQGLEVYKEVDSPLLDSLRLDVLSMISGEKGDVEAGERYCREGITAFRKLGYHHEDCMSLAVLSDALVFSGKLVEARIWAQESLRLAQELNAGSYAISATSQSLSWVLLHIGDYTQARTFALKSLHVAEKINSKVKIMALLDLVRIDLAENKEEAALERFPEIYETLQGYHPQIVFHVRPLPSLAYTHLALKQPELAEACLHQCFQAAIRTGSFRYALHSLPALALLEAACGKVERSIEVYTLALRYPYIANSKWFKKIAGERIASLEAELPEDQLSAAVERGRSFEMWEVIRGWLEENSGDRQALG